MSNYIELIKEKAGVKSSFLFGSVVQGDDTGESDTLID
jgi:predicted nucleotidyltransferase